MTTKNAPLSPRLSPLDRPRKRVKVQRSLRSAITLNERGVNAWLNGDFREAEKYFSQALCRVDVGFLCNAIQVSIDTYISMDQEMKIREDKPSAGMDDVPSYDKTSHSKASEIPELKTRDTTSSTRKRHEYDEGMTVFNFPLSFGEGETSDMCSRSLLYNVGVTYASRHDFANAKSWFQRALASVETSSTNADILHVRALHNIGMCLYHMDELAEAMIFYTQSLAFAMHITKRESAPLQAANLNCIGILHFHCQASNGQKAMEILTESLLKYRASGDAFVLQVGTVLNNIGRVYYLLEQYDNALRVYKEALAIRSSVLGCDSVDVAATIYNCGQTLHQLGQLDQALRYYDDFLSLTKEKFGEKSRDVAIVYRCIGEIYHEKGELQRARETLVLALVAGRSSLAQAHQEIASCLNKLGNLCYEMKDHDAALGYYQDGLQVEKRIFQSTHPHIIITLTNMAHIYKNRGDYGLALGAYRQVHSRQKGTFGESSIECAMTLSSIGLMQYHLKFYDDAFESYQAALRIRRDAYKTDDHVDIASTLNSIGLVLFKQNILDMSRKCFTESLRIRMNLLGADHRDVAILYYNIATIFFEMGQEEQAINLYKETLRVERVSLGPDHPDVVLTLQHIGQVLQQVGKLEAALEYYNEALEVERSRKGADPVAAAKILNLIGNIHLQCCQIPEMMKCFTEASRIFEANQSGEVLMVAGYNIYSLNKLHPEAAPIA